MDNKIEILNPVGWIELKKEIKYGTIGGRTFSTELEYVTSPYGAGSLRIRKASRTLASFDIKFFFHGEDLLHDRMNAIDRIMSQATAIRINGYISRAEAVLTDEVLLENSPNDISEMSYQITLLDPYYWSKPFILNDSYDKLKHKNDKSLLLPYTESEPQIIVGPANFTLTVIGQPTIIIVQAVSVEGQPVAYAFSASEITYGTGFNHVVVDNFDLSQGDLKKFEASKATGEKQDLSRFIDEAGNGFFQVPDGKYAYKVFLFGVYESYTLEIRVGRTHPYKEQHDELR